MYKAKVCSAAVAANRLVLNNPYQFWLPVANSQNLSALCLTDSMSLPSGANAMVSHLPKDPKPLQIESVFCSRKRPHRFQATTFRWVRGSYRSYRRLKPS